MFKRKSFPLIFHQISSKFIHIARFVITMKNKFDSIIASVNDISIDEADPFFAITRKGKLGNNYTPKADRAPGYAYDPVVCDALGSTVVSLFGGADVSALQHPSVTSMLIVDANPFASKDSITTQCAEEEKHGLYHPTIGRFILAYSPYLYATMTAHSDYDNPFKLFNHFSMRYEEYLSEIDYRTNIKLPEEDKTFEFILKNSSNAIDNAWNVDGKTDRPVVELDDLGLSTIILLRLRLCLNAEILELEELKQDAFFRIKIRRPDGTEASLYYASAHFGGKLEDQQLLTEVSSYVREELGGATSLLVRGYPPFFNGKLKGEQAKLGADVKAFISNSVKKPFRDLQCVVCTNEGDTLPDFFTSRSGATLHEYPVSNLYDTREIVYTCNGELLMGNTAVHHKQEPVKTLENPIVNDQEPTKTVNDPELAKTVNDPEPAKIVEDTEPAKTVDNTTPEKSNSEAAPLIEKKRTASPPSKDDLILEMLFKAVSNAVDKYRKHTLDPNECSRHSNGFFSSFRHGIAGIKNSELLLDQILECNDPRTALTVLGDFFQSDTVRYHRHSFGSYVLEQLNTEMWVFFWKRPNYFKITQEMRPNPESNKFTLNSKGIPEAWVSIEKSLTDAIAPATIKTQLNT